MIFSEISGHSGELLEIRKPNLEIIFKYSQTFCIKIYVIFGSCCKVEFYKQAMEQLSNCAVSVRSLEKMLLPSPLLQT